MLQVCDSSFLVLFDARRWFKVVVVRTSGLLVGEKLRFRVMVSEADVRLLHDIRDALELGASLIGILFPARKRGMEPSPPLFGGAVSPLSSSSKGLDCAQLAVAILQIIGWVDEALERLETGKWSMNSWYRNANIGKRFSSLDERLAVCLLTSVTGPSLDAAQSSCSVQCVADSDSNVTQLDQPKDTKPAEHDNTPQQTTEAFNDHHIARATVAVFLSEAIWLSQFITRALLGLQNIDVQRFEAQRATKRKVGTASKKASRARDDSVRFSSSVLQLLGTNHTELKTLFAAGLPRCLRIATVLALYYERTLQKPDVSETLDAEQSLAEDTQRGAFVTPLDSGLLLLSHVLTQLGITFLVDDISSNVVRFAALSGLHTMTQLPWGFNVDVVLLGLSKPSMGGGANDADAISGRTKQAAASRDKWKKAPQYRSSTGASSSEHPETCSSSLYSKTNAKQDICSFSWRSCLQCGAAWTRRETEKEGDVGLCPLCGLKTRSTPISLPQATLFSISSRLSLCLSSVFFSPLGASMCIAHELDNMGSRVSMVAEKVTRDTCFETARLLSEAFEQPTLKTPQTAKDIVQATTVPSLDAWTLPARGWLLRALENADDPQIRQAALDLLAYLFVARPHDAGVLNVRFQAHLPLLRGLLDSDLRVKQSAIDAVVIASKLVALKDGAVRKLLSLLYATSALHWGYLFAHLFTQCRYHDVSAVKVLLKGLMRAQLLQLERQDAVPLHLPSSTIILESADVMGPAPADFCDASLPFWFPVEEKHRALLLQNSDFLSFLLLLRCCFVVGCQHATLLEPLLETQQITVVEHPDEPCVVAQNNFVISSEFLDVMGILAFMLGAGIQRHDKLRRKCCRFKQWVFTCQPKNDILFERTAQKPRSTMCLKLEWSPSLSADEAAN